MDRKIFSSLKEKINATRVRRYSLSFFAGILLTTVFITSRSPPVTIHAGELNVTTLSRGESFRVHRQVEWQRHDCGGKDLMTTELIDSYGFRHLYPTVRGSLREGTGIIEVVGRERTIPRWFATGPAIYQVTRLEFHCFPFYSLWPLTLAVPQLYFVVKNGDG